MPRKKYRTSNHLKYLEDFILLLVFPSSQVYVTKHSNPQGKGVEPFYLPKLD